VLDQLGHRAEPVGDHRGARCEGLHDRQSEGLGEVDQVQQRQGAAQQGVAFDRTDRSDVRDPGVIDVRGHCGVEVLLVVDDAGDHQQHPAATGDLDGEVRALVRMDPPQEEQIALSRRRVREAIQLDAVVDRRGVRQLRMSVGVADRDVVADVVVGAVRRHDPL